MIVITITTKITNLTNSTIILTNQSIIDYRYNHHNHQDNQSNNLNNQLTNQFKMINVIKQNISRKKQICTFLRKPYNILRLINLTYSRQFKQNIKYKGYRQRGIRFLCGKPSQTCEDKKTMTSKTYKYKSTIQNQVIQIYLAELYPKDLLSNTYNLIQVFNATMPNCSQIDHSVPPKGLRSSTHNSKNQIL